MREQLIDIKIAIVFTDNILYGTSMANNDKTLAIVLNEVHELRFKLKKDKCILARHSRVLEGNKCISMNKRTREGRCYNKIGYID